MRIPDACDRLSDKHPWPDQKPDFPTDEHGWFGWVHKAVFDVAIPKDAKVIVEMGSWLGKSTKYICSHAPTARVIAIDHWKGDDSILVGADPETASKVDYLYERFLANCWEFKSRLIPVKATTEEGLEEVSSMGILPDIIYLDASHKYEDVCKDLELIHRLYPNVRLLGDDYGGKWDTVIRAVDEYCGRYGLKVLTVNQAWMLCDPKDYSRLMPKMVEARKFRLEEMEKEFKENERKLREAKAKEHPCRSQ